ncbi:MAG: hypothetical protein UY74_C0032G0008 [Candidatus Kaiserbacteria bacterium GW2011_GWC2_52_8b]|uniref:Uncharacterized protein n=1 Tax=Candidatus Kaiserbacteria bacterium GW2011_GWC2_52_8b TaxID=1618676 RepID=A0A0G1XHQ2_9BACT|nr:MAG: hypothetical protein UY74_C0032G0008 [Candidatus Kaiserbacteria bacterium GW2011_GWC2_52_8b]
MREKGYASKTEYASIAKRVATEGKGVATYLGEERARQGKGLDPLVDPKGLEKYGPVRGSNNLLVPEGDQFVLEYGVAMPVQTDCDLTGSMGGNVDVFFKIQPDVQDLLIQGKGAVLKRYQAQMCTGAVQDVVDQFPYQRSQFEPDNEVERQMGLLVPERSGGDNTEDYQIGLFAAAYLTDASITKYGLRGYYFAVGDEIGRDTLDPYGQLLKKTFGSKTDEVEKVLGNTSARSLRTVNIGKILLRNWHGFFLQVGRNRYTTDWWSDTLGKERVVQLPRTEDLAEVQAVIIGLTEGVLDLQSAVDFLKESKVSATEAKRIVEACSGIPIGLQTTFANFDIVRVIWPIGTDVPSGAKSKKAKKSAPKEEKKEKKEDWKL